MRLSVVVVAYGKPALLGRCLARLETALALVDGATELIVVSNGLPTRSSAVSGRVVTVAGAPDLGFAGGVAAGLRVARGEWVALVNDDCLVGAGALVELLAVGEPRDDIGAVAAQIYFSGRPGVLNSAGLEIDELGVARERDVGRVAAARCTEPFEVFGATATLGLFRRSMLDEVGGFDASFFAYLEDADLAWRVRAAGWRCLLAPAAVAVHHHSATLGHGSSAKHFLVGRNRVRMLAKNATARQLRRRLLWIVAYDLSYVAYASATARTAAPLTGRLRGLLEWRAYRAAGRPGRGELALRPAPGLRAALARNGAYRRQGVAAISLVER